jgi:pimeloyl-ACP methyl ester carboxylesterase
MKPKLVSSATATLLVAAASLFQTASAEGPPLVLKEQGSFFVGGVPFETRYHDTRAGVVSPGVVTINNSYVKFMIPAAQRSNLPMIMLPGGGHTGAVYETTPDGREGWFTYFVRKGLPVYNSDGVNRGGSLWDLTRIALVGQEVIPPEHMPVINRRHHEQAWTGFRIGPALGVPNPGTQFPVEAFDEYTNQLVPAFRDPIEDDKNVAALVALLDKLGPSIVLTWSQSGRFGVRAAVQRPNLVKALIQLEPAAVNDAGEMTGVSQADLDSISQIPILLEVGDFDAPRIASLTNFCSNIGDNCTLLNLPELGIFGNGHVVMVEENNQQVADLIIAWLRDAAGLPQLQASK